MLDCTVVRVAKIFWYPISWNTKLYRNLAQTSRKIAEFRKNLILRFFKKIRKIRFIQFSEIFEKKIISQILQKAKIFDENTRNTTF